MKLLLVAPPIMDIVDGVLQPVGVDAVRECPPLGVYALAAYIEALGHTVVIADLVQEGTQRLCPHRYPPAAFDLVGISSTSMAWPTAVEVIQQVHGTAPDVPIVCGGIHPSLFPAHVLTRFPVRYVICGEGERSLAALCSVLQGDGRLDEVPGLAWKDVSGTVVRNRDAAMIDKIELGCLPVPDLGRLEPGAYKCLAIESSRGCAFDCSFCSTPYRRSWRAVSPAAFVERFEQVLDHLDRVRTDCVHIVDDEFALNPRRAMAIADGFAKRGLAPRLLFDARAPDVVKPGFLERYAPLTAGMLIGAECGYDEGLVRVGKGTTCRDLERAAAALARAGIADRVDFSFILGLPWEGVDEVEMTIRFATRLYALHGVHVMLQWYRQIPGSNLWAEAARRGKVSAAMYDRYGFFGDYYLLSTSCRLKPHEMYRVGDLVDRLGWIAGLHGRIRPSIAHALPAAFTDVFPPHLVSEPGAGVHDAELHRLSIEGVRA